MAETRSHQPGSRINLEKVNCLLVDDSQQSVDILATVCAGFGIRSITKCLSGADAIAALNRAPFDLVLTDAQMPDMSGYELIRWIRREAAEPNRFAPIILITGHTRSSQVLRARDCGAHFTVAKPVTPKVLLDRICWVARDERSFIECDTYCGPDRRFKREGPPVGMQGRRHDDLSAELGEAKEENMSQDEINALMKPAKVSL